MKISKSAVFLTALILLTSSVSCSSSKETELSDTGLFAMDTYMTLKANGKNADSALKKAENRIRELEWNIPKNVHFVPVDFEKERMCDKLIAAGFDPAKKTFFSILGVSYYLTLDVFADTLRQMAELSSLGSTVVFDYPIKTGDFPRRVARLEKITEELGEVMRGGFDYNEVSRALYSLGFQIDTYMPPEKVQKEYFDGRADGMRAFENVSLISATYTAVYNFE